MIVGGKVTWDFFGGQIDDLVVYTKSSGTEVMEIFSDDVSVPFRLLKRARLFKMRERVHWLNDAIDDDGLVRARIFGNGSMSVCLMYRSETINGIIWLLLLVIRQNHLKCI